MQFNGKTMTVYGDFTGAGGACVETEDGGVIFNDLDHNEAGELAAAFGEKTKAPGKAAIAAGSQVYRRYNDDEDVPATPPESDRRSNEAIGAAAMASGLGAVAYSRGSKSLGHRTQTGYPPSAELAAARPEAVVLMDENGIPTYPPEGVGQAAVAIGADTAALGNHSLAGGCESIAKGASAFAFGSNVKADGDYSIATGVGCTASGTKSFAGGAVSEATAAHAFAFGYHNKASGEKAVAMGNNVEASGANAAAFGSDTKAKATSSIAAGHTSETNTKYSAAMGYFVKTSDNANAIGQMVVGRYNATEGIDKAMLVVGSGNGENTRKNSLVVNRDGSAQVAGELSFGSVNPESAAKLVRVSYEDEESFSAMGDVGKYVGEVCIRIERNPNTDEPIACHIYMYVGGDCGWVLLGLHKKSMVEGG